MIINIFNSSKYRKTSYSQSGEDLIIKYIFDVIGLKKPSYIDIGAHNPECMSNTHLFYLTGSRGINIEADPALFHQFPKKRPKDINLNIGIAGTEGELDMYCMSAPSLNTFSQSEVENLVKEGYNIVEIKKLKVTTVQNVISQYFNNLFPDFLSLDVEGFDDIILESIDYSGSIPIVVCVETITFSMSGRGIKKTKIIEFMKTKGYIVYADTNINTIFVLEKEWVR